MQNKERPPRVYSDKKGSYIINGDRKMRITPLNNNKNENNNQNVVNVILKECRTKQKRRRMTKPKPKQPIPMKPLEQQVNDANYRLYHIIQDRKREAQEQLKALIQKVQEKSIGIPSTDNSLVAIAKDMKKSPSEIKDIIMPSVSQQILNPALEPAPASTPPDEKKNSDVIMEEPSIPDEEEEEEEDEKEEPPQGEVPPPSAPAIAPPIPQYTDQLISNVKDLDANLPSDSESSESSESSVDELKQQVEQKNEETLKQARQEATTFLQSPNLKNKNLIGALAKKYELDEGLGLLKWIKELPNNSTFLADFMRLNKGKPARRDGRAEYYYKIYESMLSGKSQGKGKTLMTGLYNDQIDDMLRHEPKYFGCISRDEIHKLQLDDNGCYGFIYNTVPSNKPTIYDGHWRAIYIDLDDGKSIDHYDSFGEPAEEDIQNQIGSLLKQFNLPYYLKWKDNKIVNQRSNSSNCGFFCVNFLQDRFEGIPFVDSTGYSNANKAEKDLKKKFGYLID